MSFFYISPYNVYTYKGGEERTVTEGYKGHGNDEGPDEEQERKEVDVRDISMPIARPNCVRIICTHRFVKQSHTQSLVEQVCDIWRCRRHDTCGSDGGHIHQCCAVCSFSHCTSASYINLLIRMIIHGGFVVADLDDFMEGFVDED